MKLYIISNRLPVKATSQNDHFAFSRSEGGLATGLNSLEGDYEKHWIGWPGICLSKEREKQQIKQQLEDFHFHPVFLSDEQYNNFYEGYSNSTLWPLCHYFYAYTLYKHTFWEAYKEVNQLFCDEICRLVEPDDWVWVQDYQLMLLPQMLRNRLPNLHIGYFHHIPFPSYELFRILPERSEILKGLLGADFIAFHTHDYMRHFISAAERVLHVDFSLDEVRIDNRIVRIDALPMGINYDMYHQTTEKEEIKQAVEHTRLMYENQRLILSVDRLDYSKGILHRLKGFSSFLEHHPEYHGKVTLAMVIVPSRDHVESYAELKTQIDKEIGAVNGRYSTIDWTPISYFYHAFTFEQLVALYTIADIALVTPLRDGMNLVAKEYVTVKQDQTGVLVLSEMAGAAAELTDALLVNPNDTDEIERSLCQALEMPLAEQKERMQHMQSIVSRQTVNKWAHDFVHEWNEVVLKNRELRKKLISPLMKDEIKKRYEKAHRRLILLDYDGTLAAFHNKPEEARPSEQLLQTLQQLTEDSRNCVVINSGRDHYTLEKWLGHLPVSFAAEHGAFIKENGSWHRKVQTQEWGYGLLSVLKQFVERTPHSHLEVKEMGLAWHYRETDSWLGSLRAQQLVNTLLPMCQQQHLQLIKGNKVVEIKSASCTKGTVVESFLNANTYDFILAMGDDTTDEDMFRALPAQAHTIKIGTASENARYNLEAQTDTIPFLHHLQCTNSDASTTRDKQNHPLQHAVTYLKRIIQHPFGLTKKQKSDYE